MGKISATQALKIGVSSRLTLAFERAQMIFTMVNQVVNHDTQLPTSEETQSRQERSFKMIVLSLA